MYHKSIVAYPKERKIIEEIIKKTLINKYAKNIDIEIFSASDEEDTHYWVCYLVERHDEEFYNEEFYAAKELLSRNLENFRKYLSQEILLNYEKYIQNISTSSNTSFYDSDIADLIQDTMAKEAGISQNILKKVKYVIYFEFKVTFR